LITLIWCFMVHERSSSLIALNHSLIGFWFFHTKLICFGFFWMLTKTWG
jgi:hypothetical protein